VSEVKPVMFAVSLCDKCKDSKIVGDRCVKCKLDNVIQAKIDLNLELVATIDHQQKKIDKLVEALEYYSEGFVCMTQHEDGEYSRDRGHYITGVHARETLNEIRGKE
jgi:DnaJ-class molecular chaperone